MVFPPPTWRLGAFFILIAALTSIAACAPNGESPAPEASTTGASETDTLASLRPATQPDAPAASVAAPVPTPEPRFEGFDFEIGSGDFWDYRWSSTSRSCAQGSGCSSEEDSGLFRVELGDRTSVRGTTAYEVILTGDRGTNAPPWRFIAVEDMKILGSMDGSSLVVLFDGQIGAWAGSGFFDTRFDSDELSVASHGSLTGSDATAGWAGVHAGPAIVVGRAQSQSECEIIEGRRICPRQESYSFTEREWYRPGVGAVGYSYRSSSSFSGGGFFSSYASEETVALVASSLRGDVATGLLTETPDLTDFVEEFLAGAINAEIATYENADVSYISQFMTGEPLRRVRANLESLSAQDMIYLPRIDFGNSSTVDVRAVNDGRIEVDRCELWSGSYYARADRALVREEPVDLVPQTITLEHLSDGWFITRIDFYDEPSFC